MLKKVEIYTDGACRGNPGIGGWGAHLRSGVNEKSLYGAVPDTTNNRMELMAAISALKHLKLPCDVDLYTDSEYVKNGITTWLPRWKERNWRTSSRSPVKNSDLWQLLEAEALRHTVRWHWVKGHSGHPGNEMADALANRAIDEFLQDNKMQG